MTTFAEMLDELLGTHPDDFAEARAAVEAAYQEASDGWHRANGVADLAMKHRDVAEAEAAALRADAERWKFLAPKFNAPGANDWPAVYRLRYACHAIAVGERPGEERVDIHMTLEQAVDADRGVYVPDAARPDTAKEKT